MKLQNKCYQKTWLNEYNVTLSSLTGCVVVSLTSRSVMHARGEKAINLNKQTNTLNNNYNRKHALQSWEGMMSHNVYGRTWIWRLVFDSEWYICNGPVWTLPNLSGESIWKALSHWPVLLCSQSQVFSSISWVVVIPNHAWQQAKYVHFLIGYLFVISEPVAWPMDQELISKSPLTCTPFTLWIEPSTHRAKIAFTYATYNYSSNLTLCTHSIQHDKYYWFPVVIVLMFFRGFLVFRSIKKPE